MRRGPKGSFKSYAQLKYESELAQYQSDRDMVKLLRKSLQHRPDHPLFTKMLNDRLENIKKVQEKYPVLRDDPEV